MEAFVGALILWGVIALIKSSSDGKKQDKLRIEQEKKDRELRLEREKRQRELRSTLKSLLEDKLSDSDLTREEIDWLHSTYRDMSITELNKSIQDIKSFGRKATKKEVQQIRDSYHIYTYQKWRSEQQEEENRQWNEYLEGFKLLNKAQQQHEIDRLKKLADPDSSEDQGKINILELIRLGGEEASTTDVMIGNTRLFTLKKK